MSMRISYFIGIWYINAFENALHYFNTDVLIYLYLIYSKEVNFEELARCTDDFNGAQLKAVCVEAVSTSNMLYS